MKTLHLQLIKQWFGMVRYGEKKEEYRDIKPYWVSRLIEPINGMGREIAHVDEMILDMASLLSCLNTKLISIVIAKTVKILAVRPISFRGDGRLATMELSALISQANCGLTY